MSAEPLFQDFASATHLPPHRAFWRLLTCWYRRHRQRADLADLDDHLLADIGKTREQVRRECVRPFWR